MAETGVTSLSIRLPVWLMTGLESAARSEGNTVSAVVRRLISNGLRDTPDAVDWCGERDVPSADENIKQKSQSLTQRGTPRREPRGRRLNL